MITHALSATSFRDPAGFMFEDDGTLFRQVNRTYRGHYDHLIASGLYEDLTREDFLVPHEEVDSTGPVPELVYKVIAPRPVEFISYPYEWCFSQLRDAALLTLAVQRQALAHGMSLKDASVYNVQFHRGRPIFIDTLSFETYREGEPWVAYRQFCQHFLAPLALMSLVDRRLNQLCRTNLDGIPLELAARLLPNRSRLRPGLAIHLHLHASMTRSVARNPRAPSGRRFSRHALLGLIDHLETTINRLRDRPAGRGWIEYYQDNTYTAESIETKASAVAAHLDRVKPGRVWDLGANTGRFSRIASERSISTISFDLDVDCVEANYQEVKRRADPFLLPLELDLLNPSPASGWLNQERPSLLDRGKPDLVLALALIHHLAFTGNLPLEGVARFFDRLAPWLVIEFVPPNDPQVARLRQSVDGLHHRYDQSHFESCFGRYFELVNSQPILDSGRVLYLFRRRSG
ncbi:SAM-dependent methyltransferase [Paludisphaera borealis]|uniref:SAM-dependent methyltransferase n=1 Tax=Paludisphaera borealis TaxID=1387353 RepID=A0A1U7CLC2_9BACT|nr:SAM-dependent methyltransferase [Paludisphaera borealis]APW59740.1 hypothetical protein BSF38_01171 [Paludisphaera borealis]